MPIGAAIASSVIGGMFSSNAADSVAAAQRAADAARLAEEKRVREQLRADTEKQRGIADQAFADYQSGLISYAEAQQRAGQALQQVQQQIGTSQLSDVAKIQEMAKFTPYGVTSGTGTSFVNPETGQAGFNLSPELQKYQQGLYGQALQAQQGIAATPETAAQKWYDQQQALLAPQRAQQDVQNRASQLQRGTLGLGVSSEAAGFGKGGGLFNAQQASVDRARAQADAALAAQATQQGQAQAANQLALAQGLFGAGYQPEQYGMQNLKTGVDIGNIAANQGAQQARLYSGAMAPYYTSLLGAAETGQNAALFTPQATQQGLAEQYKRQQDQLAGLLNYQNLNYSPMSTPSPQIPGSAYIGASLGSQLMGYGMQNLPSFGSSSAYPSTGIWASSTPGVSTLGGNLNRGFVTGGW